MHLDPYRGRNAYRPSSQITPPQTILLPGSASHPNPNPHRWIPKSQERAWVHIYIYTRMGNWDLHKPPPSSAGALFTSPLNTPALQTTVAQHRQARAWVYTTGIGNTNKLSLSSAGALFPSPLNTPDRVMQTRDAAQH